MKRKPGKDDHGYYWTATYVDCFDSPEKISSLIFEILHSYDYGQCSHCGHNNSSKCRKYFATEKEAYDRLDQALGLAKYVVERLYEDLSLGS